MANLNLQDSSNIKVVQSGSDISMDFASGGQVETNTTAIGDLTDLTTTDKSNLVDAINEVNNKNIITVGLSSNQSMTGTGTVQITVDTIYSQIGNDFTFDSSTHRITIGDGVSYVKVSGTGIFSAFTTNGLRRLFIRKNGVNVARQFFYYTQNYNAGLTIPPRLIPVQSGDYIDFSSQNAGNSTLAGSDIDTWFTVEAV